MKILFDHQLFSYQRYGGASKYFAMLLNSLPRNTWETTTLFSNNVYVEEQQLFKTYHLLKSKYFPGQGRIMNELNKPYSAYRISKHDYDVFHQTHFEPYCLNFLGRKPLVTTFHDINFLTLNPKPRVVKEQKKSLARANAVIAISENTKRDLIQYYGIDEHKIHVIYHGIEQNYIEENMLSDGGIIEFPYILYVGTRNNHKNFISFIKAFSILHQKYPEIKVICTLWPFSDKEYNLFKSLKIEKCMLQISADEATMRYLYQHALFFIFPSLYEGFGMPILEAMINKCPVVLSNASCFPEIAQDAGLYFEPQNIDEIYNRMEHMICDSSLREDYIERGKKRVKEFSWEKCANLHMKVYESLI